MGMGLLILDLPRTWPRHTALATAADELRDRGIEHWSGLELRATASTGTDLIRRFTFTYWATATAARTHHCGYQDLWERLDPAERAALMHVASGTAVSADVTTLLVRVAGEGFLPRDRDGHPRLPRSLRHFLRAMDDRRR
ncbi:hypothetical protein CJ179_37345 [Rhodococcus sp. ACS1]|uniref:hypothetical protein n=1 Tax=Rhodococcus sp. ACS1 TaxID=2028570 RepID=UPI000BB15AA4|nr:hypothetical protein [Rhodococcus sp. ACS1]PBC39647.1 hypothetical protein CJ179_37345 [Rhodococcus sp. ACS1]